MMVESSTIKRSGLVMIIFLLVGCGASMTAKTEAVKVQKTVTTRTGKVSSAEGIPSGSIVFPERLSSSSTSVEGQEFKPVSAIERCDRELRALKQLDEKRYSLRKVQFDRLMSGAAMYAGIRTEVAGDTREAMDALYHFRTGKLCSEISHDVLDALSRQGRMVGQ